jgi:hypothetical protein
VSFPRRRESIWPCLDADSAWIPAYAGMTKGLKGGK